jgi:hypothetical protein
MFGFGQLALAVHSYRLIVEGPQIHQNVQSDVFVALERAKRGIANVPLRVAGLEYKASTKAGESV